MSYRSTLCTNWGLKSLEVYLHKKSWQKPKSFLPYRFCVSQGLRPAGKRRRNAFFKRYIAEGNYNFSNKVLWSNGTQFTRYGLSNGIVLHYWTSRSSSIIYPIKHQIRWKFNVWSERLGDRLIEQTVFRIYWIQKYIFFFKMILPIF